MRAVMALQGETAAAAFAAAAAVLPPAGPSACFAPASTPTPRQRTDRDGRQAGARGARHRRGVPLRAPGRRTSRL